MSDPLKFFLRHCHLLTPVWIQNSPNEPRTLAHFYQTDARWSVENNEYNVAEVGPQAAARPPTCFCCRGQGYISEVIRQDGRRAVCLQCLCCYSSARTV